VVPPCFTATYAAALPARYRARPAQLTRGKIPPRLIAHLYGRPSAHRTPDSLPAVELSSLLGEPRTLPAHQANAIGDVPADIPGVTPLPVKKVGYATFSIYGCCLWYNRKLPARPAKPGDTNTVGGLRPSDATQEKRCFSTCYGGTLTRSPSFSCPYRRSCR
jgi:hypothetical protein